MKALVKMREFLLSLMKLKQQIQLLEENLDFKLIIKKRLHSCANKPRRFL